MTHPAPKPAKRSLRRQPASVPRTRKTITVKPFAYQPSKAELDAEIGIAATPEDLARAILQPVTVKTVNKIGRATHTRVRVISRSSS